jgi:hypothetical protein
MANVLNEETKRQVLALGRLGWSLGRIEQATGIRRETVALKRFPTRAQRGKDPRKEPEDQIIHCANLRKQSTDLRSG